LPLIVYYFIYPCQAIISIKPTECTVMSGPHKEPRKSMAFQAMTLAGHALTLPPSILLSSTVMNLLALALPLVILQIYNRVLPQGATGTLYVLTASLVAVTVIEGLLKWSRGYLLNQQLLEKAFQARQQAAQALLQGSWASISSATADVWQRRLTAVDDATGFGKTVDQTVLLDLPYVVLFLVLTWLVGGVLVWVPIGVIALFFALAVISSHHFREALDKRGTDEADRYQFLAEVLRGITTVKLAAIEPLLLRRAEDHAQVAAENSHRIILESNRFLSLGQLFASVTMIMVVTVGGYLVITGQMSVGGLACCTLLATRTTQPVLRTISAWTQLQGASVTQQMADEVLSLKATVFPALTTLGGGRIELRDIEIAPTSSMRGFSHLNLSVGSGDIIGITGGSSSGKSVLLSLIAGTAVPLSGVVSINDRDLASEAGQAQLRNVCLLGGHPTVFRGTILDNITLGRGGDTVPRAVRAISLIGFQGEINRLPEGFETPLGDSATEFLPRRFIQSIALARALTARAKIVLIDEASAYFTHDSQVLFRSAVDELAPDTTFVLTDQRVGKLNFADRVYAIEDGRLRPIQDNSDDRS
jgi:ATP-binding cassette subfamily C protein LapB